MVVKIIIYVNIYDIMHTNINLQDNTNQYVYVVECNSQKNKSQISDLKYSIINDSIIFNDNISNMYRDENIWRENIANKLTNYIPELYNTSIITLYFPQYSIETYKTGFSYALTLNTWIHGKKIVFGTYIFNRADTFASDKVKTFYNNKYYECIQFEIINPWDLMYSDEWYEFRKNVCGEYQIDEAHALNSVGSILNITLYPVEDFSENFIMIDGYHGGQNSLNLSTDRNDFLNLYLKNNIDDKLTGEPAFICDLRFNNAYEGSLKDYICETYNINRFTMSYELVIGNENNLYGIYNSGTIINKPTTHWVFDKSQISPTFSNGLGWCEGINAIASINIMDMNGNSILYILSNPIPLTAELFKYFIGDSDPSNTAGFFILNGRKVNNVNLDKVNMYSYNINAVNKIEKKIVQINRPENSKSNIISPVFFSTQLLSDIIIHPEVTETICINLDAYKSKVDRFIIKIDGCLFQEIGRISSGVLFKIVGNNLQRQKMSGSYYILDQNSELVTTGKYNYVL